MLLAAASVAYAGSREQAKRIHDRIAGVPPSADTLDEMAALVPSDPIAAARIALEDPAFYDVTLKNFVAPWTNEAMSPFVPLNDYTATVIGIVRDNVDFRQVLSGDILYKGANSLAIDDYANDDNKHYEDLEKELDGSDTSLSDPNVLVSTQQSAENPGLPAAATAGVMTTRAAAKAFFSAGTNRAMFRFTLMNHLCKDLEQVADTTRPPDRIRQDVSRSPGGDSRVFLNNCVGCHSGMDPMAQAYAYYDYEYDANTDPDGALGQLVYNTTGETDETTGTRVQDKYHINSANFEPGYVTPDDDWENYWRKGPNENLGWNITGQAPANGSGEGAKSMGRELANSSAFAECQVTKVFQNVCLRSPATTADRSQIGTMIESFKSGYNLKDVFAQSAVYCMGE
jgi:hypothetical protein